MARIGTTATALVAFVVATVGLLFDLRPELRPDPRERIDGAISVFAIEPDVRYDDFLRRSSTGPENYRERRQTYLRNSSAGANGPDPDEARDLMRLRGTLFYVKTTLAGFKRRSVVLRWSMYSALTNRRLSESGYRDVAAADVRLDAPSDSSIAQVWTPPVFKSGKFFARFHLVTTDGYLLAVADGQPFDGALSQQRGLEATPRRP